MGLVFVLFSTTNHKETTEEFQSNGGPCIHKCLLLQTKKISQTLIKQKCLFRKILHKRLIKEALKTSRNTVNFNRDCANYEFGDMTYYLRM